MAINLANSLLGEVEASYLCCTRQEGMLKKELKDEVGYLFLNKKYSLDLNAFWKLRTFVKKEQIELIHAHGTSWFFGVLLKLTGTKIKLVWHDHYGESELLDKRDIQILKPLSRCFDGIVSVNTDLKKWAENTLKMESVIQLNNFISQAKSESSFTNLKGKNTDFKIICVANLRPQKDHLNLLRAFEICASSNLNISLHLVGEGLDTPYSKVVLDHISSSIVTDRIFLYGSQKNIPEMLKQANLGVLASRSEGMPLALLEYGMAGLPVICTKVGQCPEVLSNAGILVSPCNPEELAQAILSFAENNELCLKKGAQLKNRIRTQFGENSYRQDLLEFYKKI
jgi:glycosyltransferase involved in cell wall biosynthesis